MVTSLSYGFAGGYYNQNAEVNPVKKEAPAAETKVQEKKAVQSDYYTQERVKKLSERIESTYRYNKDASKVLAELMVGKVEVVA